MNRGGKNDLAGKRVQCPTTENTGEGLGSTSFSLFFDLEGFQSTPLALACCRKRNSFALDQVGTFCVP